MDGSGGSAVRRGTGEAVWRQIEQALAAEIARGEHPAGGRLPTETDLAGRFGVNRHTVRQAMQALQARGLVRIVQGRGTFVGALGVEYALGRRTRFAENLAALGLSGRHVVLGARREPAADERARRLKVRRGTELLCIETLGEANGLPISVAEHWFVARRVPCLEEHVARLHSISKALAAAGVDEFHRQQSVVTARLPDERTARLLQQAASRPVLQVESVNVDGHGKPLEYGRAQFAGDLVQLAVATGG